MKPIFQQQFHGRFPCQIVRSLLQVYKKYGSAKNVSGVNRLYMTERERLPYAGQQTLF